MGLRSIGPFELLIILAIIVMIFGASRLTDIGGALGRGIKEFRHSVQDESEEEGAAKAEATEESAKS